MRLGIKPTVDFAFKKIFGTPENVPILLGLVNAVLQLREPLVDVEILNPFSYREFEDDKLIVLDIRARNLHGRQLALRCRRRSDSAIIGRRDGAFAARPCFVFAR